MCNLGVLKREENLRSVWPNEANDFTPWLAKNLSLIGDVLGVDLELVDMESKVGTFSADILAKEVGSENLIVIENQLEDSNHDHLGKLITYASGKNAKTIVWIVKRARDEHRKAIEWLNENTDAQIGFYLLEIELWSIGNSELAPKFNVVEGFNGWAKTIKTSLNESSDTRKLQIEFWQAFNDYANKTGFIKDFRLHSARAQHDYGIAIGDSRCCIVLEANRFQNNATVGLYIHKDKSLYQELLKDQSSIESALGCELQWREKTKASRFLTTKSFDMEDASTWNEVFDWFIDNCYRIKKLSKKYLLKSSTSSMSI